jgi:hypothetical protein
MKAKEFINGNMPIPSETELEFFIPSVNEPDSTSGTSTGATTDPDVSVPPKN